MTTKEQIIQELEEIPESMLEEVLEVILSLKQKHPAEAPNRDFWDAYVKSKQQREEVYRRLANS